MASRKLNSLLMEHAVLLFLVVGAKLWELHVGDQGCHVLWEKNWLVNDLLFRISVAIVFGYEGVKTRLICFEGNRTS